LTINDFFKNVLCIDFDVFITFFKFLYDMTITNSWGGRYSMVWCYFICR